ncbi:DNA excision repair protein ERCC-1-like [Mercurialis annua]|uniref:DNA excision repair protein ERCC-1-like n=1 Tax=Mercurialis annua TaxID=3986 RepID=UPI00215E6D0C|nr:DNA excision repair protein ERCC-1-like [Mercurialis annua]
MNHEDVVEHLLEVTKTALLHDCTLLCAWSLEECGHYLETVKIYENKPADLFQGYIDTDHLSQVKRLYDAFHEPFKQIVSSNPVVPETFQKDPEPSLAKVTEVEKGEEVKAKELKEG